MWNFEQEVEGHLLNWFYHERVLMGITLDGKFIHTTALGIIRSHNGMIVCCSDQHSWFCPDSEEINNKAMRIKRVDT